MLCGHNDHKHTDSLKPAKTNCVALLEESFALSSIKCFDSCINFWSTFQL